MNVPLLCGNGYAHLIMSVDRSSLVRFFIVSFTALASAGAASAVASGCGGGGTETTPLDAGSDATVVILNGGGEVATSPNGVPACPGACNYQTNEGCAAAQTCFPNVSTGTVTPACTAAGSGGDGASCTQTSECASGYMCALGEGVCRKLCCGGDWSACPDPDQRCLQKLSIKEPNGATVPTGAMVCVPVNDCDPLAPHTCKDPNQACQIIDGTGAVKCLNEGQGEQGESCPCAGGYLCVANACRRLCKAVEGGGDPYCQAGEGICVHYNRDPPGVGECTPQDN